MASRGTLPSDPDFLLDFMHDLPDESDSDDDFDGYLEPEDGPIAYRNASELEDAETSSLRHRSRSLQDLSELEQGTELLRESPLSEVSHSPSPMQGEHASGSPLALAGVSPTPTCSSTLTGQVKHIKI